MCYQGGVDMLILVDITKECSFKSNKEFIKYFEDNMNDFYKNDPIETRPYIKKEDYFHYFEDSEYIYNTQTNELIKANKYLPMIAVENINKAPEE